ncbi:undecaprenyl diphosphate synthase family protein, partial [Bradyrhizobium sp.]|uniref:undecaprenyl diphosphate synthase family protein n=1 Tax=Bradyrhizobium sp. TaxID=376 RepID=UPI001EB8D480
MIFRPAKARPGPEAVAEDGGAVPRHVAVIMDGNGRWAENRGMRRIVGHRRGIQSVRSVVEEGCRIGLDQLTLYCLSIENWKRPPRELTFLLSLFRHFLVV